MSTQCFSCKTTKKLVLSTSVSSSIFEENIKCIGFDVIREPVLHLKKIRAKIDDFENICAVIITSQNAVHALLSDKISKKINVFTVGEVTASLIRSAGYENVFYPRNYSAADMMEMIRSMIDPSKGDIVYFCGNNISLDPSEKLREYKIRKILSYETSHVEEFSKHIVDKIIKKQFDYVSIHSSLGATSFVNLCKKHSVLDKLSDVAIVCVGNKSKKVIEKNFKKVIVLAQSNMMREEMRQKIV